MNEGEGVEDIKQGEGGREKAAVGKGLSESRRG